MEEIGGRPGLFRAAAAAGGRRPENAQGESNEGDPAHARQATLTPMLRALLVLGLVAAALASGATASTQAGFALGRTGGNIRPFTVAIAADGTVSVSGPVQAGRTKLTRAQLAALTKIAADTRFTTLPKTTNCAGTLPDVASTFVRVGARTVRVHGECVPRYARLWRALTTAVELSLS